MTLSSLIGALQDIIEALNDGATPTPNTIFDQVWIGEPEKIPMGARNIAIIEAAREPDFYYSTCDRAQSDVDIHITVLTKGTKETATTQLYSLRDIVKTGLLNNTKISNTCIGSTIEEIIYGSYSDVTSQKNSNKIEAFQLTLRCRITS